MTEARCNDYTEISGAACVQALDGVLPSSTFTMCAAALERGSIPVLEGAVAAFRAQQLELAFGRIDEAVLESGSGGKLGSERAGVVVAAAGHLCDEGVMAQEEGGELALPADRLRMAGVAASLLDQHGPDGVQLAMLAEQVCTAEHFRWYVPNTHWWLRGN